ncbi:hypothetical protein V5799_000256 [Amblyomma americanum]|uniref:Uncharacterized protein n=1 Tax=Amblyomma americanum TaxID=6943 RepID=A0AAQ4D3K2_AMBAM
MQQELRSQAQQELAAGATYCRNKCQKQEGGGSCVLSVATPQILVLTSKITRGHTPESAPSGAPNATRASLAGAA